MSAKNTLGGVAIINAILDCEQKNRGNLFYLSRGDAYVEIRLVFHLSQMNYQPRIEWVHIHWRNENILTTQLQHPRNTHFASETIICNNNNLNNWVSGIQYAWHTSRDSLTIPIHPVYIHTTPIEFLCKGLFIYLLELCWLSTIANECYEKGVALDRRRGLSSLFNYKLNYC